MEEKSSNYDQNIFCSKRNEANLLCCSQNCNKNAFLCGNTSCNCLSQNHPHCEFIHYQSFITMIKARKQNLPDQIRKAVNEINKIYEFAIQKISTDRQQLRTWQNNYGLSHHQIKFIQMIGSHKKSQISGKMISIIKNSSTYEKVNENYQWLTDKWVKNFWESHQEDFLRIFRHLDKFNIQKHRLHENGLQIPSVMVSDQSKIKDLFVEDIHKLKLLYRASQNDFSVQKFHEKVNGISNTMVIALTDSNKIIGGYTPLRWHAHQQRIYQSDHSMKSFVFHLSDKKRYGLKNPTQAIQNHKNQGPTFGKVYSDLYISDESHKSNKNLWNPGNTYSKVISKSSIEQQQQLSLDNAQEKFMHVCIKQWQVFEVIFENNEDYD